MTVDEAVELLRKAFPRESVCYDLDIWSYRDGSSKAIHCLLFVSDTGDVIRVESSSLQACIDQMFHRLRLDCGYDGNADVREEAQS